MTDGGVLPPGVQSVRRPAESQAGDGTVSRDDAGIQTQDISATRLQAIPNDDCHQRETLQGIASSAHERREETTDCPMGRHFAALGPQSSPQ